MAVVERKWKKPPSLEEVPFEILREGQFYPLFWKVGFAGHHKEDFRIYCGCFEIDEEAMRCKDDGYHLCGKSGSCNGYMAIDFGAGGHDTGIVVGRCGCDCNRKISRKPMHSILGMVYKSPWLAVCGVARFFLSSLIVLPRKIVECSRTRSIPDGTTIVMFALLFDTGDDEYFAPMFVQVKGLMSSWMVHGELFNFKNGPISQNCSVCGFGPSSEEDCSPPFRVKFGMECGHAVCETCCPDIFVKQGTDEIKRERSLVTAEKRVNCFCVACNKDVGGKLTMPLLQKQLLTLKAPSVAGWYGVKPVFSQKLHELLRSFYEENIGFIADLRSTLARAITTVDNLRSQKKAELQEFCNTPPGQMSVAWAKKHATNLFLNTLNRDADILRQLSSAVKEKERHIMFTIMKRERFPDQMLDFNYAFYSTVMEKTRIFRLIAKVRKVKNLGLVLPGEG